MASVSNMEEAATVASEYVASLENLPNEVQFLLAEIRLKDIRSQEVQQDIDKLSAKYFRYQLRGGGNTQDHIPAKIAAEYATLSALADEKRALADRLAVLISRSRARLDYDLQRMLKLTGENPGIRTSLSMGGPTPMTAIVNHLQASLAPAEAISASVPPPTKRRRTTVVATSEHTSPEPVSAPIDRTTRVRKSPAVSRRSRVAPVSGAVSEDDEEGVEEEGDEDTRIYCFCQQTSHGEMIGCDNEHCKYAWFHLACVGIAEGSDLPQNWYCKACVAAGFGPQPKARKGRKK